MTKEKSLSIFGQQTHSSKQLEFFNSEQTSMNHTIGQKVLNIQEYSRLYYDIYGLGIVKRLEMLKLDYTI
jgi:hypothetical protein